MKIKFLSKLISFAAIVSCFCCVAAAATSALGPGFNSLHWGDPPLFYMDRIDRRDGMDVYFLPSDADRYAGVETANIRYLFRSGRLCRVEVGWRKPLDRRDYQTLLAALTRDWGQSERADRADTLFWHSDESGTEVRLEARDNPVTPWIDYDTDMTLQALKCQ